MLKTYLQVELNEFFQEKMESSLFENVSEMDKSQFIGNFFQWMRTAFKAPGHLLMQKDRTAVHEHEEKHEEKHDDEKKEEKHKEHKEAAKKEATKDKKPTENENIKSKAAPKADPKTPSKSKSLKQ